ncbi:UNVERIFIED_CONTAM: hypothetical protein NCL1_34883 [Trichonephila clavipes]
MRYDSEEFRKNSPLIEHKLFNGERKPCKSNACEKAFCLKNQRNRHHRVLMRYKEVDGKKFVI